MLGLGLGLRLVIGLGLGLGLVLGVYCLVSVIVRFRVWLGFGLR